MRFRAFLFGVLCWGWPAASDAQIYAWRDANGTLVLSDRNIEAPTDVYTVQGAPSYVTTRPPDDSPVVERFEGLIQHYSNQHSLSPDLVRAVIQVESGFDPRALSPKGAMGLMQLMPDTARRLGVRNPWDPEQNIRGGTRYLRLLLDQFDDNERLALAAYNAGEGAVARYGGRVPPYRETQDYVRKVGAAKESQAPKRKLLIYKTIEILDGRAVPRYSSERPSSGTYEVLGR